MLVTTGSIVLSGGWRRMAIPCRALVLQLSPENQQVYKAAQLGVGLPVGFMADAVSNWVLNRDANKMVAYIFRRRSIVAVH